MTKYEHTMVMGKPSMSSFGSMGDSIVALWCLSRSSWDQPDLRRIVFRDKFSFHLYSDDHRRHRSAYRSCHTGPQPGVFLWSTISFDCRIPFVIIGIPWLCLLARSARPHTERVAVNCLTAFKTLTLLARLLVLSLIKHVRDMMKKLLYAPENVDDLARQLEKIWLSRLSSVLSLFATSCDSLHLG
ncbi:transposable element Tc1 transposase [Trichonephila clavipes]|nr:transposable element Tc1 transposase [Trichonephila clavipes]